MAIWLERDNGTWARSDGGEDPVAANRARDPVHAAQFDRSCERQLRRAADECRSSFTPSHMASAPGILFVGFLAGQYPSVLLQQRIGMRRWMAICALLWGICAGGMAFIETHWQFYTLRVLLGLAEGGLAPGIVLYLRPVRDRARARYHLRHADDRDPAVDRHRRAAIELADEHGPALRHGRMALDVPQARRCRPWCSASPPLYFPDRPGDAKWLDAKERTGCRATPPIAATPHRPMTGALLRRPLVWASALLWFCLLSGSYSVIFWLPQIVKQMTSPVAGGDRAGQRPAWIGNIFGIYFNSKHFGSHRQAVLAIPGRPPSPQWRS